MKLELKHPLFTNYYADNLGNIYSIKREGSKGGLLKQFKDKHGYLRVNIYLNGKLHQYQSHRFIAEIFIKNAFGKPCINHKDCNKLNNSTENLEWCTISENILHAYKNGLIKHFNIGNENAPKSVKVIQIGKDGSIIYLHNSVRKAAANTNTPIGSISQCINGKLKTAGGFIWKRN